MGFWEELVRRNVVKVGIAYAVVAWVLIQVADVALSAFELPSWVFQIFLGLTALGFPVTIALAWIFDLTPRGIKRTLSGLSVVALAIAGVFAFSALIGRDRALLAQSVAEQEAATSQEVIEFLVGIFEVSDPYANAQASEEISARELLDRGSERVERELADQPEVQARLLNTMGEVYSGLGLHGRAQQMISRALSIRRELPTVDDGDISASLYALGRSLNGAGDYAEAQTVLEEALGLQRAAWGSSSIEVARTLDLLAPRRSPGATAARSGR